IMVPPLWIYFEALRPLHHMILFAAFSACSYCPLALFMVLWFFRGSFAVNSVNKVVPGVNSVNKVNDSLTG
ncbi:MAG: hypothetical protein LUD50_04700, partial [Clostridia bacterium]|nr:hypothetical protein [Clostridia bacterium]